MNQLSPKGLHPAGDPGESSTDGTITERVEWKGQNFLVGYDIDDQYKIVRVWLYGNKSGSTFDLMLKNACSLVSELLKFQTIAQVVDLISFTHVDDIGYEELSGMVGNGELPIPDCPIGVITQRLMLLEAEILEAQRQPGP
jgi:hypothetical protein